MDCVFCERQIEKGSSRGGSWADDDTITFRPFNTDADGGRLMRVSSAGGAPEPVTTLAAGEVSQRFPQVLPGGKGVLYYSLPSPGDFANAAVAVQPLPMGARRVVVPRGYFGRYLPSGHVVFIREGTLFAAPFDVDRLQLTGPPAPVLEDIALSLSTGVAQFAFASNGTFAYVPGGVVGGAPDPIEWMDRTGKISTLRAQPSNWSNPAFSPDGRRLAIDINDGKQTDVWVYEWDRDTLSRLTFDPANDWAPLWTPDGRRIVFASDRADKTGRVSNLYWQRADGAGEVQRLTESTDTQAPSSWQPTGRFLAFMDAPRGQNPSIMILPIEGDEAAGWKPGKPTVFLDTPANEFQARFSPDGKWLAYMSNESGQNEVYVRPFPGSGGKWQISTDGGTYPVWSRTRPELFYVRNQRIMVATYAADRDSFRADRPRQISETPLSPLRLGNTLRTLDLHPDGERFALATRRETSVVKQDKVVFIFNFFDELRRIAPSGRSAVGSQQ